MFVSKSDKNRDAIAADGNNRFTVALGPAWFLQVLLLFNFVYVLVQYPPNIKDRSVSESQRELLDAASIDEEENDNDHRSQVDVMLNEAERKLEEKRREE